MESEIRMPIARLFIGGENQGWHSIPADSTIWSLPVMRPPRWVEPSKDIRLMRDSVEDYSLRRFVYHRREFLELMVLTSLTNDQAIEQLECYQAERDEARARESRRRMIDEAKLLLPILEKLATKRKSP